MKEKLIRTSSIDIPESTMTKIKDEARFTNRTIRNMIVTILIEYFKEKNL